MACTVIVIIIHFILSLLIVFVGDGIPFWHRIKFLLPSTYKIGDYNY